MMSEDMLFQFKRRMGHEQMKFEIAMHRRMQKFHPDNQIARWANSSTTRYGFSRLMVLQRYEDQPLRKSEIAEVLLVSYQAVVSTVREALDMGIIIEPQRNHYMASDYAWESHLEYLQERYEISSSLREAIHNLREYKNLLSKLAEKSAETYKTALYCNELLFETGCEQEADNSETQQKKTQPDT